MKTRKKLKRNDYNVLRNQMQIKTHKSKVPLFCEFNFLRKDTYFNKGTLWIFDIF